MRAFYYYYLNECTLREIQCALDREASKLQVAPPTPQALTNWLCRGDILKALLHHLLCDHASSLQQTLDRVLAGGAFLAEEQRLLRERWVEGYSVCQLRTCHPEIAPDQLDGMLQALQPRLIAALTTQVKAELHNARNQN